MDGQSIMNFIIALLENLGGKIDDQLPQIISLVLDELSFISTLDKKPTKFESLCLQALSSCFMNNA